MSQYAELDRRIVGALNYEPGINLKTICTLEVDSECRRLAELTGRPACRILDGRIKALKKIGAITYMTGKYRGWYATESETT